MAYVWLPQLAPMRRLPEFKAYMREIGMVAYWQEYGWPDFCRPLDAARLRVPLNAQRPMTTPTEASPQLYRFADLTLDVGRRRVTRQGQLIELKSLDFDLLRFLVESAPDVVNADVLAEKVWGRHYVSPENVSQRIMLLRQSLDDDANRPRYIETVRNKGYRLIPVVEQTVSTHARTAPRRRWLISGATALLLAAGLTAVGSNWLTDRVERPAPLRNSVAVLPFESLRPARMTLVSPRACRTSS